MKHDNIVTFTHKDEDRHIQAANMVGREPDSRVPETSTWRYDGDEAGDLDAQQAEARLRGDNPEITRERRATEVSSGTVPTGTSLNPNPH
jgi:hypothetical protein